MRVMLAANDVVRSAHRVASDPPASFGVAVVPTVDRVPPAEQGQIGERTADDGVTVGVVPGPSERVPDPTEDAGEHDAAKVSPDPDGGRIEDPPPPGFSSVVEKARDGPRSSALVDGREVVPGRDRSAAVRRERPAEAHRVVMCVGPGGHERSSSSKATSSG
jgi:hypothetical protein